MDSKFHTENAKCVFCNGLEGEGITKVARAKDRSHYRCNVKRQMWAVIIKASFFQKLEEIESIKEVESHSIGHMINKHQFKEEKQLYLRIKIQLKVFMLHSIKDSLQTT